MSELKSNFEKCQQLLNSIAGSISSKSMVCMPFLIHHYIFSLTEIAGLLAHLFLHYHLSFFCYRNV